MRRIKKLVTNFFEQSIYDFLFWSFTKALYYNKKTFLSLIFLSSDFILRICPGSGEIKFDPHSILVRTDQNGRKTVQVNAKQDMWAIQGL